MPVKAGRGIGRHPTDRSSDVNSRSANSSTSARSCCKERLDKRNFPKKILGMGLLVDTGEIQQDVAHRAARLHRFDERRYQQLRKTWLPLPAVRSHRGFHG